MQQTLLPWRKLMQIADSALPIGTLSHSFGLETLVAEGTLSVERLSFFLQDYLEEAGRVEAAYCLKSYRLGATGTSLMDFDNHWLSLNRQLDALKVARESREASAALGRRFLQLAARLDSHSVFERAVFLNKRQQTHTHYCAAFGLTCGAWAIQPELAVASFLQQSLVTLVSACQRLLPLGQTDASRLTWELKGAIVNVVGHILEAEGDDAITPTVGPLFAVASMAHP